MELKDWFITILLIGFVILGVVLKIGLLMGFGGVLLLIWLGLLKASRTKYYEDKIE